MTTPLQPIPLSIFLNGRTTATPQPLELHAGPLRMLYDGGALRYIRLGEIELVRQIYSAVRDQNWGTIPGVLSEVTLDQAADHFHLAFTSTHQQGEIDFRWQGQITGAADGTLTFTMIGQAYSTFWRNRIGFCVLHSMDCAGVRCRIEHTDGTQSEGVFPEWIVPNQPFQDIRSIQHEVQPGLWVEVRMEGDAFEMEDQRNWIDASYKTYCTPLALPFPVQVAPGDAVQQKITLRLMGEMPQVSPGDAHPLTLTLDETQAVPLPPIGLCVASHDEPLSERAFARLGEMRLSHVRVDVRPDSLGWQTVFARHLDDATRLHLPLELAVHLGETAEEHLRAVAKQLEGRAVSAARWLIFRQGEKSTHAQWIDLARRVLGDSAVIVGGTDAFFTELNRQRPESHLMDGVVFSTNPQVHAFDDASLVETLAVQRATIVSACQFCGEKPIHVSPITFKMRWNPNATAPVSPTPPGELPHQTDVRQMSLFGALWTMGSIKYLALGGAASLTYYETTGPLGVMSTEAGSPQPHIFFDFPGGVYPVAHLLMDVGEFAGGEVCALSTSDVLRADGLALRHGSRLRLIVANLTAQDQMVLLHADGQFVARWLTAANAESAMRDPEAFRARPLGPLTPEKGVLRLALPPYALITLDRQTL